MENEITTLTQKMLDTGKAQAENGGWVWSNKHPTFRQIMAAFEGNNLEALKACWIENFA